MHLFLIILKGIFIGICSSAPLGPIAIFVMQNTLGKGRKAGMSAAMGSTVVDTLFAAIAVFSLSLVQGVIDQHYLVIKYVGGAVVIILGIYMSFYKHKPDRPNKISATDFAQSLLMGLTNPGAFAVMLALFAVFGFGSDDVTLFEKIVSVASVCLGTIIYWNTCTWLLSKAKGKINVKNIVRINRIAGVVVILFGIYLIINP